MNGTSRPTDATCPLVGEIDAGEDLEQRALAGAVAADDAEELARLHIEVDVAQRVLHLDGPALPEHVDEMALERRAAQVRQQEVLRDAADLDRPAPPLRPPRRSDGERRRKNSTDADEQDERDADRDDAHPRRAEDLRDRHRLGR